jgi:hypothetical protein
MRRLAVAVVIVLAAGVPAGASGLAADSAAVGDGAGDLRSDFNNDGFADLAIGVPQEPSPVGITSAGEVNVFYGGGAGLRSHGQLFTQDSSGVGGGAEAGDRFGSALATGDFDNDGFADLAIGVPGEGVGSVASAGAVNVLYGGRVGVTGSGSQLFTQNSPGVGGGAERGDIFGSALSAGDFDRDGFADLAIGVVDEDVGSITNAGAVNVLYGGTAGLTGSGSQLFTQNSAGVGGGAEPHDLFGSALSAGDFDRDGFADLAIGVPQESIVGGIAGAGAVNVLYGGTVGLTGSGSQTFTQNSPGVGGGAEQFDLFGWALAAGDFERDGFTDLAIGVPNEDVGSVRDAGAVNVLYGRTAGLAGSGSQLFTQNSAGVGGGADQDDLFGWALAAADFDSDGFADVAIDVRFEAVGSVLEAGAVNVLYGGAAGLTGSGGQLFTQDSPGVGSSAATFERFGEALTVGDFDRDGVADLAIGVPGEDVDGIDEAGAVHVLYGGAAGLTGAGSQFFTQNSPAVAGTAEAVDRFGQAVAASGP